jgi:hypothetical protein
MLDGTRLAAMERADACGSTGADEHVADAKPGKLPSAAVLNIPFGKTLLAQLEFTTGGTAEPS